MTIARRAVYKLQAAMPILSQPSVMRAHGVSPFRMPRAYFRYLLSNRETSNFTYDIANIDELIDFIANALSSPRRRVETYLEEAQADDELADSLRRRLRTRRDRNTEPRFGRRLGWYALVRLTKPRIAVETGTADGLGTALLARAIERNVAEGYEGELLTFDVDQGAGWLLDERAHRCTRVVYGDTMATLESELGDREIDLFVHDSLHTYDHERAELDFALAHAGSQLILVSDNAHATTALFDVAREAGGAAALFREVPVQHFYDGAGIGLAVLASDRESQTA